MKSYDVRSCDNCINFSVTNDKCSLPSMDVDDLHLMTLSLMADAVFSKNTSKEKQSPTKESIAQACPKYYNKPEWLRDSKVTRWLKQLCR